MIIGWLLGMLVGVPLSVATTAMLHPGVAVAFLIGLVLGMVCSLAGGLVGMMWEARER